MSTHLCITVQWIGDQFHGFTDDKRGPEWPPSPLRLFQALVSGAYQHGVYAKLLSALKWLERQAPPDILAERNPSQGKGYDHFVPDNDYLLQHKKPIVRIFKPVLLAGRPNVHFVWGCRETDHPPFHEVEELCSTLSNLGCGVDQAFAFAHLASITEVNNDLCDSSQFRHCPIHISSSSRGTLRTPKAGTLDELNRIFQLNRAAAMIHTERRKKRWPTVIDRFVYSGLSESPYRPRIVFKLVDANDDTVTYPQAKLMHIAGMVRHLAIKAMTRNPPRDLHGRDKAEWVEAYVSGHQAQADKEADAPHSQFSYIPLQSIGTLHTDPGVRRVMIVAPLGDEAWLEHLASQIEDMPLQPLHNTTLPPGTRLERIDDQRKDGVRDAYLQDSATWASVTPVILPGHNDHKPAKTLKLIQKALAQSGVDQPCEFEWSAHASFRKSLSAHKYVVCDGIKRPAGYLRPGHLLNQAAVHLQLKFQQPVPGPIAIGAGRHCGFGLFAAVESHEG